MTSLSRHSFKTLRMLSELVFRSEAATRLEGGIERPSHSTDGVVKPSEKLLSS